MISRSCDRDDHGACDARVCIGVTDEGHDYDPCSCGCHDEPPGAAPEDAAGHQEANMTGSENAGFMAARRAAPMTTLSVSDMAELGRRWYTWRKVPIDCQTGLSTDGVYFDEPTADGQRMTTKIRMWTEVERDLAGVR